MKENVNFILKGKVTTFLHILFLMLFSSQISATTIRSMTLEEVVRNSDLVFEGRVIGVESVKYSEERQIYTLVEFQVIEVITGFVQEETLILSYLGGEVGGKGMKVANMIIPAVGDEGIFFVESLEFAQVHPLTGWGQGHYPITIDLKNTKKMITSSGNAIKGLGKGTKGARFGISSGRAIGIEIDTNNSLDNAISLAQFKDKLKKIIGEIE